MEWGTICYIIGSAIFIFVGLLHLYVHYNQLINADAQQSIQKSGKILVGKDHVEVWLLWGGMSLLFGFFMFIIGVMNIVSWYDLLETKSISKTVCILNLIMMVAIIYSGFKYFGRMQIYGGMIGFILFSIALIMG